MAGVRGMLKTLPERANKESMQYYLIFHFRDCNMNFAVAINGTNSLVMKSNLKKFDLTALKNAELPKCLGGVSGGYETNTTDCTVSKPYPGSPDTLGDTYHDGDWISTCS